VTRIVDGEALPGGRFTVATADFADSDQCHGEGVGALQILGAGDHPIKPIRLKKK